MKNIFLLLIALLIILGASLFPIACVKPFTGVSAILSNNYIKQRIYLQIIDASATSVNPYPANSIVTLGGEGVSKGLIYTDGGQVVTNATGNVVPVQNVLSLAIKPYTVISSTHPIRFSINVSAQGYLSTSNEIVVNATDSLQYIEVKLIKLSNPPLGVIVKESSIAGIINGNLAIANTITVKTGVDRGLNTMAELTFPANTSFKDATGGVINSNATLGVSIAHFSNNPSDALTSVPGGINNVTTSTGSNLTFLMGGAIDINASLGNVSIRSFTNPLTAKVTLSANTLNPLTGSLIKAGDKIEVWSNNGTFWTKEGTTSIVTDPITASLQAQASITHLSTWLLGFGTALCNNSLKVLYKSNTTTTNTHYIAINDRLSAQLLCAKKISVKNGDTLEFFTPVGVNCSILLYVGSSDQALPYSYTPFNSCAPTTTLQYTAAVNPLKLYFNLETICSNGIFRYSGPIDYKVSGSSKWESFTPSDNGTLTTTLLKWDVTYDFRIIYKGLAYTRSRKVTLGEFRQQPGSTNSWEFWGKDPQNKQLFFNSPTSCN